MFSDQRQYDVHEKRTDIYPILFDSVYRKIYRHRRDLYAMRDAFGFPEIHRAFKAWCHSESVRDINKDPTQSTRILLGFVLELDEASLEVERVDAAQGLNKWNDRDFKNPEKEEELIQKVKRMKRVRAKYNSPKKV